jgi:hypothetical protein
MMSFVKYIHFQYNEGKKNKVINMSIFPYQLEMKKELRVHYFFFFFMNVHVVMVIFHINGCAGSSSSAFIPFYFVIFTFFLIVFASMLYHIYLNKYTITQLQSIKFFTYLVLAQGQTQGSTLQQCTNKTLTTSPFGNTYEVDEVSPEVEVGGVAGLKCLQPS